MKNEVLLDTKSQKLLENVANKQATYKLASVDTTVMVAGQAGCSFILELELKGSDGDAFPVYLIGRHLC